MKPSNDDDGGTDSTTGDATDERFDEWTRAETDGGSVSRDPSQSPFDIVSDVEQTRSERYRMVLDSMIVAPGKILWNDWRAKLGFLITFAFVLIGTVGVWYVDRSFADDGEILLRPFETWAHPLGTDSMGRDILSELVHATPAMLEMMFAGALFSMGMAVFWGVFSGYKGGSVDRFMMAVADIMMTIPGLPLVVVLAAILDPSSPWMIGIIVVVNAWAGFARALRSEVLKLRHESYVEASRTIGIAVPAILVKDILPNVMPLIVVNFVTTARNVIMMAVGLYFLGLLPNTGPNWGMMLQTAYGQGGVYRPDLFHWFYAPMVTIVILSLGLLLLGQGLDRIFNPRIRARHAKHTGGGDSDADGEDEESTSNEQYNRGGL
ncbi:ABC transporter permease [Halobacteria archaeon AArc-m2/3/4]|uniref:ABC transporter permease n=1 Tax=Natronoglomus mannanivorans TaxID=2979990 RepID=A0AAP3E2W1_9EURY|nr:ABC transporter permease [Halobacteria archaeon AArc-xg1-1]MCU4973796.1 ABC transporter permease [Halobacteria archaeon AArc-m2/3/4]